LASVRGTRRTRTDDLQTSPAAEFIAKTGSPRKPPVKEESSEEEGNEESDEEAQQQTKTTKSKIKQPLQVRVFFLKKKYGYLCYL